jgi:hypothetical protein
MALDDYLQWGLYHEYGFFKVQKMIYFYWEGRFTATFIWGVFEMLGIVDHYYFLVFLLYAFSTWMALLILISSINSRYLGSIFAFSGLLPASLILLVLDLYVMAEISSGVYWLSAVTVYQTAFILFLMLAACLVRRFAEGAGSFCRWDFIIISLAILICGCNEIAAIALACCFLLIIGAYIYYRRRVPRVLFLYLGVILLTGVAILLTSGVLSGRTPVMKGRTGNAGVGLIILARGLSIFYYIFKEPLFWVCGACSYVLGVRMSAALEPSLHVVRTRRFFIPGLLGILLVVLCTLAPVLVVTHGSIPERAINNLTSLSAFYLLGLAFLSGACKPGFIAIVDLVTERRLSTLLVVLLSCALLASYNYKEAWKNVATGYFYHAIQADRQKVFLSARERHQRSATITPYAVALDEKIRRVFPHGVQVTVQRLLKERPTYLYFENVEELSARNLSEYYHLDSLILKQF